MRERGLLLHGAGNSLRSEGPPAKNICVGIMQDTGAMKGCADVEDDNNVMREVR